MWADGVTCPHCGVHGGRVYDLSGVRTKASAKNPEGKVRHGLKKCGECRKQFTAKVGTVFEHARMPLHKMLQAVHLMVSSKKGISAHQLSRVLEVQYKSAWFLAHRIREAMRSGNLAQPFGGNGGAVEVDETYIGFKAGRGVQKGTGHKLAVVALVDRDSGQSRWFHVENSRAADIHPIVLKNIAREARLMTDEAKMYRKIGREFAEHGTTTHGRSGSVAAYSAGEWTFLPPRNGMTILVLATSQFIRYHNGWEVPPPVSLPSGGTVIDSEARSAIASIRTALITAGILPQS